jgi:hypothetical protein
MVLRLPPIFRVRDITFRNTLLFSLEAEELKTYPVLGTRSSEALLMLKVSQTEDNPEAAMERRSQRNKEVTVI